MTSEPEKSLADIIDSLVPFMRTCSRRELLIIKSLIEGEKGLKSIRIIEESKALEKATKLSRDQEHFMSIVKLIRSIFEETEKSIDETGFIDRYRLAKTNSPITIAICRKFLQRLYDEEHITHCVGDRDIDKWRTTLYVFGIHKTTPKLYYVESFVKRLREFEQQFCMLRENFAPVPTPDRPVLPELAPDSPVLPELAPEMQDTYEATFIIINHLVAKVQKSMRPTRKPKRKYLFL